jgi:Domain of unknown function (DUF4129)
VSVPVRLGAAAALLCVVAAGSAARIDGEARVAAWALALAVTLLGATVVLRAGRSMASAVVAAAVLALALSVTAVFVPAGGGIGGGPGRARPGSNQVSAAPTVKATRTDDAIVAVLLLVAAGLMGVAVWRLRRRDYVPEPVAVAPVREAVLVSLEDVRRERNVRRAIVICYARMERALAAVGAGRRPAETPFEYLGRVVEAVAAAPARVLTELYERAMFSLEPMGEREKKRAIEALEALRQAVFA